MPPVGAVLPPDCSDVVVFDTSAGVVEEGGATLTAALTEENCTAGLLMVEEKDFERSLEAEGDILLVEEGKRVRKCVETDVLASDDTILVAPCIFFPFFFVN